MRWNRWLAALNALALIVALIVVRPASAQKVRSDGPQPVTFTITSGDGSFGSGPSSGPFNLVGSFTGTVDTDGSFTMDQSGFHVDPIAFDTGGFGAGLVTILLKQPVTGTFDANLGEVDLHVSLRIDIRVDNVLVSNGGGPNDGCGIDPVEIDLTTGSSGADEGRRYDARTGTMSLVSQTFAVPASSGCPSTEGGIAGGILDGQLAVPAAAGVSHMSLTVQANEPFPQPAIVPHLSWPGGGFTIPQGAVLDFDATGSTSVRPIRSYALEVCGRPVSGRAGRFPRIEFDELGPCRVRLTVTDSDGDTAWDVADLIVAVVDLPPDFYEPDDTPETRATLRMNSNDGLALDQHIFDPGNPNRVYSTGGYWITDSRGTGTLTLDSPTDRDLYSLTVARPTWMEGGREIWAECSTRTVTGSGGAFSGQDDLTITNSLEIAFVTPSPALAAAEPLAVRFTDQRRVTHVIPVRDHQAVLPCITDRENGRYFTFELDYGGGAPRTAETSYSIVTDWRVDVVRTPRISGKTSALGDVAHRQLPKGFGRLPMDCGGSFPDCGIRPGGAEIVDVLHLFDASPNCEPTCVDQFLFGWTRAGTDLDVSFRGGAGLTFDLLDNAGKVIATSFQKELPQARAALASGDDVDQAGPRLVAPKLSAGVYAIRVSGSKATEPISMVLATGDHDQDGVADPADTFDGPGDRVRLSVKRLGGQKELVALEGSVRNSPPFAAASKAGGLTGGGRLETADGSKATSLFVHLDPGRKPLVSGTIDVTDRFGRPLTIIVVAATAKLGFVTGVGVLLDPAGALPKGSLPQLVSLQLAISAGTTPITPTTTITTTTNPTTSTTLVPNPKCVSPKDGAIVDASKPQTYSVLLANFLGTMRISFVEDRAPNQEVWSTTVAPGLPAGSLVEILVPGGTLQPGRTYRWLIQESLPNLPGSTDCGGTVITRP